MSNNNQLLGQPTSTPGPAFVQYKLNGKTISSEAEEKTMQRGHGSGNKINQKTQSEKNQNNQVNENNPFVGQQEAKQGPTLNTVNRTDPSSTREQSKEGYHQSRNRNRNQDRDRYNQSRDRRLENRSREQNRDQYNQSRDRGKDQSRDIDIQKESEQLTPEEKLLAARRIIQGWNDGTMNCSQKLTSPH